MSVSHKYADLPPVDPLLSGWRRTQGEWGVEAGRRCGQPRSRTTTAALAFSSSPRGEALGATGLEQLPDHLAGLHPAGGEPARLAGFRVAGEVGAIRALTPCDDNKALKSDACGASGNGVQCRPTRMLPVRKRPIAGSIRAASVAKDRPGHGSLVSLNRCIERPVRLFLRRHGCGRPAPDVW